MKTYALHGEKNFSKIGGHVFAKRKFIERRKESVVPRKEQSLESLTQKLKRNHRMEATVVTVVRNKN